MKKFFERVAKIIILALIEYAECSLEQKILYFSIHVETFDLKFVFSIREYLLWTFAAFISSLKIQLLLAHIFTRIQWNQQSTSSLQQIAVLHSKRMCTVYYYTNMKCVHHKTHDEKKTFFFLFCMFSISMRQ